MKRPILVSSILVVFLSILYSTNINYSTVRAYIESKNISITPLTTLTFFAHMLKTSLSKVSKAALSTTSKMSPTSLQQAKITPHRSSARGHADHGWLNTYHSFSFASWYNPSLTSFGALRVLNEDRVKPNSGFPTHPHRDFEIFSYILSGELTHRDSMLKKGSEGGQSDKFYRMRRGDVQFTTGGTGIAHSEFNEHSSETVHFLQIWAVPWARGLKPRYHTRHFDESRKREGFVPILSPLKGGVDATAAQETAAEPTVPDTIPIHADFVMAAGIIVPEKRFEWTVGAKVGDATKRKVYVHLPMTQGGRAKVRLDGRDDAVLEEGDGAFVDNVKPGDKLAVESIGEVEAEVIVLDTA